MLDNYNLAFANAGLAAKQPYQAYPNQMTANLTPAQYSAFNTIDTSQGIQAPFISQGANNLNTLNSVTGQMPTSVNNWTSGALANPYANQIQNASRGYTAGQVAGNANTLNNPFASSISQAEQGISPGMFQGFSGVTQNPYASTIAANMGGVGIGGVNNATQQLMNPYTQNVVNSTMANINETNAEQQQQVVGNAISQGAFGGDRSAIAQSELARQQALASNQTLANLQSQGFTQSQNLAAGIGQYNAGLGLQGATTLGQLGAQGQQLAAGLTQGAGQLGMQGATTNAGLYGQQQQLGAGIAQGSANLGLLGASQLGSLGAQSQSNALNLAGMQSSNLLQGAGAYGNLGNQAQQGALTGASAQLQSGAVQQAQNQSLLNNAIQQFYLQQQYPFQNASFLANVAEGLGSQSGGTTNATVPSGNLFSELGGLGIAGIGLASLLSDRRAKENIEDVGKTYDRQTIYRFNYKGDPTPRIGLMAQEVQKRHPSAVSEIQGVKGVNYWDATEDAAKRGHFAYGGLAGRPHFDDGGSADGSQGGGYGGGIGADMGLGSLAGTMDGSDGFHSAIANPFTGTPKLGAPMSMPAGISYSGYNPGGGFTPSSAQANGFAPNEMADAGGITGDSVTRNPNISNPFGAAPTSAAANPSGILGTMANGFGLSGPQGQTAGIGTVDSALFGNAPANAWTAAPPTTPYAMTPSERDMAIRTINAEDPNSPAAVAAVMNNRFQDASTGMGFGQYGKTFGSQISAPAQFSGYGDANYRGISPNSPTYSQIGSALDGIMSGSIADPTNGATSYYGPGVGTPSWARGQPSEQIGAQHYSGFTTPPSAFTPDSQGGLGGQVTAQPRLSFSQEPAASAVTQYGVGNYGVPRAPSIAVPSIAGPNLGSPAASSQYGTQYGSGNYSDLANGLEATGNLPSGSYLAHDSRGNPVAVGPDGTAISYNAPVGVAPMARAAVHDVGGVNGLAATGNTGGTYAALRGYVNQASPNVAGDYTSLPDTLFQSRSRDPNWGQAANPGDQQGTPSFTQPITDFVNGQPTTIGYVDATGTPHYNGKQQGIQSGTLPSNGVSPNFGGLPAAPSQTPDFGGLPAAPQGSPAQGFASPIDTGSYNDPALASSLTPSKFDMTMAKIAGLGGTYAGAGGTGTGGPTAATPYTGGFSGQPIMVPSAGSAAALAPQPATPAPAPAPSPASGTPTPPPPTGQIAFTLGAPAVGAADAVALYRHALGLAARGGRIERASGGVIPYNNVQTLPYGSFGSGQLGPMVGVSGIPVSQTRFPSVPSAYDPTDPMQQINQAAQFKNLLSDYSKGAGVFGHARGGRTGFADGGAEDVSAGPDVQAPGVPASGGEGPSAPPSSGFFSGLFGGNSASAAPQPFAPSSQDKAMALMSAGFGMMASRSPHALQGIGEGAMQGVNYLAGAQGRAREAAVAQSDIAYKKGSLAQQAADLQVRAKQIANEFSIQTATLGNQKANIDSEIAARRAATAASLQTITPAGILQRDPANPMATPRLIPWSQTQAMAAQPAASASVPAPGIAAPAGQPATVTPAASVAPGPTPQAGPAVATSGIEPPDNIPINPMLFTAPGQQIVADQTKKTLDSASTANASAQNVKLYLGQMQHDIDAIPATGWLSAGPNLQQRADLAQKTNVILRMLGVSDENLISPQTLGAVEDLKKLTNRMGFDMAKSLGGREPGFIVQQAIGSVPGGENSPAGLKRLMAGIGAVAQRQEEYYTFMQKWASKTGGDLTGADDYFNKARPPQEYANRAIVSTIPEPYIARLRELAPKDPSAAKFFDQRFGKGTSVLVIHGTAMKQGD